MGDFSIFEVLGLIFVVQASVLILTLLKSRRKTADTILAGFLLVLVLCFCNLFVRNRWDTTFPYFYLEFLSLLGPLIWLYIKAVTDRRFKLSWKYLHAFWGVVAVAALRVSILIKGDNFSTESFEKLVLFPLFVYVFTFIFLSVRIILRYQRVILQTQSAYDKFTFRWFIYQVVILGLYFITLFMEGISIVIDWGDFYEVIVLTSFLSILLFINVIIYKGLKSPTLGPNGITEGELNIIRNKKRKYLNSPISRIESSGLFDQLENLMQEKKPYLNPDLSLRDLSMAVGTKEIILSQVINENAKVNFNDYINGYRVLMAKQLFAEHGRSQLIKEIMYDSGFQSTSTFNKAFRKLVGMSPSQFRSKL